MRTLNTREFWDDLAFLKATGNGAHAATPSIADLSDHPPSQHLQAQRRKAASKAPVTTPTFDGRAAAWLSLGFISGMIAWHAVGFWGFVTDTILKNDDSLVVAPSPPAYATEIVSGCVALVYGARGRTSAKPCLKISEPLRDAGRLKRTDRMASIEERLHSTETWTNRTAAATTPPATALTPRAITIVKNVDLSLSAD